MTVKNRDTAPVAKKAPKRNQGTPENLEQEIRIAAQRNFEDRRRRQAGGDEVSDWLSAETEVREKREKVK